MASVKSLVVKSVIGAEPDVCWQAIEPYSEPLTWGIILQRAAWS
jgi:hypothetical protein